MSTPVAMMLVFCVLAVIGVVYVFGMTVVRGTPVEEWAKGERRRATVILALSIGFAIAGVVSLLISFIELMLEVVL